MLELVRKPFPPIFGLFEILDRNFVKLVAPPSSKREPSFLEKNLKTASKSAYKRQRNACSNYAPLEHYFSIASRPCHAMFDVNRYNELHLRAINLIFGL